MFRSRFGLGPVFVFEGITRSRRRSLYAGRAVFVAAMLAILALTWISASWYRPKFLDSLKGFARLGESFFYALTITELVLLALMAPAAAAGAICLDRERGSLAHMLVTDLSSVEIVLGKLVVRLIPPLSLLLCGLPVMYLASLLGGIDPLAVVGACLATTGLVVVASSLAFWLSVWGSKVHEVLAVTYLILLSWLLAYPMSQGLRGAPGWIWKADPLQLTLAPYSAPGSVGWEDYLVFLAGTLAFSGFLAVLSVLQLRKIDHTRRSRYRRWSWFSWSRRIGPSLDSNPVLWREWRRNRASRWMRAVWALYYLLSAVFVVMVVRALIRDGTWEDEILLIGFGLMTSVGLLFHGVEAATVLAEERVRGSLDVVLATPLPTSSIVWGKWWGAYRGALPLLLIPALVGWFALDLAGEGIDALLIIGLMLAYGVFVTSLGLVLATWARRPGTAVALTVGILVVLSLGLFLVEELGLVGTDLVFAGGSPFVGPLIPLLGDQNHSTGTSVGWRIWLGAWMLGYLFAAASLYVATLLTFNRCLGRATGQRNHRSSESRPKHTRARRQTVRKLRSAVRVQWRRRFRPV